MARSIYGGSATGFAGQPIPIYVGPGDVIAGAVGWWGLRAYNSAAIGANAVRLRRDVGSPPEQDFSTITGGGLNLAAIAAFKGVANLFVVTLYDQSGNGYDVTQATPGTQPTFTLNGLGSFPIISYVGATPTYLQSASVAASFTQPISYSAVVRRTSAFTSQGGWLGANANGPEAMFAGSANNVTFYAGGATPTAPAADSTWHAIQDLFNGASSNINVDGFDNLVSGGTGGIGGPFTWYVGRDPFSNFMTGDLPEVGAWAGDISPSFAALYSNQHLYWGF